MRVAHICTKFSRLSETFIYDLILGLERAGVENRVLTAARINASQRPFPRVTVLRVPFWRQAAFVMQKNCLGVYDFPLPAGAARRALADSRADAVLAHFGGAGLAIEPVARELGLPLVVVFHAFDLFMRQFTPATYATLWPSLARAVAVSEHGKARLLELGCPADKIQLIHCGVDLARFAPAVGRRAEADGLHLVSIGRFVEKKGFDDLLRALAMIRLRVGAPVHLDIWGYGPLQRPLEHLQRELGLQDLVEFRGVADCAAVPEILRQYDAFVLPSKAARDGDTEGIPITILEAQATGLPVIATVHAGIPEALPTANREWLAHPGDVEDLSGKLVALASQPGRWKDIGLAGRDWVARHFSLDAEVRAYRGIFQDLPAVAGRT